MKLKKQHATVLPIAAKMFKQFCGLYFPMITKIINKSTAEGTFKTFDRKNKENYRFFSLLSHMLKVFERILYKPNDFMKDKLPKIFTGFRKGHIAQHSSLIKDWKMEKSLRWEHESRTNFYESFKGLWHLKSFRLLLAKLKAYSVQPTVLKQIENYLKTIRIALLLDPEKKKT